MVSCFHDPSDGTNEKQAYMYFGHSETVNPFHVVFGLYNSSHPLVASDWPELAVSHPWQTSKMLGFSHNLALVAMERASGSVREIWLSGGWALLLPMDHH